MSAETIVTLAVVGHFLVALAVARKVTWQWVLDSGEGFGDETLPERAFTALAALTAALLWPVLLLVWGLTLLMPRPSRDGGENHG